MSRVAEHIAEGFRFTHPVNGDCTVTSRLGNRVAYRAVYDGEVTRHHTTAAALSALLPLWQASAIQQAERTRATYVGPIRPPAPPRQAPGISR